MKNLNLKELCNNANQLYSLKETGL